MNFQTPTFDAAVARMKADFAANPDLLRSGQFFISDTMQTLIGTHIENELRANVRLMFLPPGELDKMIRTFKQVVDSDDAPAQLRALLDLFELNGDMAGLRNSLQPSANDVSEMQALFNSVWGTSEIKAGFSYPLPAPSVPRYLAGFRIDKDKCFVSSANIGRKLQHKRGVQALPANARLNAGLIANARLAATPRGPDNAVGQQLILYSSPDAVATFAARMKAALNANGVIQCGVLSGARHDDSGPQFPTPEHYVLVIAHDVIEGRDAFLFWDPDSSRSHIGAVYGLDGSEVAPGPWGRGFGLLFNWNASISTAFSDEDLVQIDTNKTHALTYGDHLNLRKRHCYQVYSAVTLP